ncbi:MAG: hypothetical protein AB7V77_03135 [Candidatus Woesearchaeota archaeon]
MIKNKKAMDFAILVSIILGVIIVALIVFSVSTNTGNVVDTTNDEIDAEKLADFIGVSLYDEEIRYNAIDELKKVHPDFITYVDLVIHQMFDPEYPTNENGEKFMRYYNYFELTSYGWGFKIYDDGIGLSVVIIDQKNNQYMYMSHENVDFLKNKHINIIAGNPNKKDVDEAGVPEFAMTWLMNLYCGLDFKLESSFIGFDDSYERINEDLKESESATYHFNTFENTYNFNHYDRFIYPLKSIEFAPRNVLELKYNNWDSWKKWLKETKDEEDNKMPELAWVKDKSNELEFNRLKSVEKNGHLILKLNIDSDTEYFVFFPSTYATDNFRLAKDLDPIRTKEGGWYDLDRGTLINFDNGYFKIEGIGFPFDKSVDTIINHIDYCD